MRALAVAFVALLTAFLFYSGPAAANLTILDPFVNFEPGQRNHTIRVANAGGSPIKVKVSLINLRRQADGTFAEAGEPLPGEQFADGMVRFSPSQFTLAPGAQQAIRVAAQLPADLGSGQYRTYLRLEEVGIGQTATTEGGIQIGVGFIHQLPITIIRP